MNDFEKQVLLIVVGCTVTVILTGISAAFGWLILRAITTMDTNLKENYVKKVDFVQAVDRIESLEEDFGGHLQDHKGAA